MASVTEQIRQQLEDIENYEKAAAILISEREKRKKNKVFWETCVKHAAKRIKTQAAQVLDLIADRDALKSEELALLAGLRESQHSVASTSVGPTPIQGGAAHTENQSSDVNKLPGEQLPTVMMTQVNGVNRPPPPPPPAAFPPNTSGSRLNPAATSREIWRLFYDKLKQVQDYYKKFSAQHAIPDVRDAKYYVAEIVEEVHSNPCFSPAEKYGNEIELFEHMDRFVNLKKYRRHREAEHRRTEILRAKKKLAVSLRKGKGSKFASMTTGGAASKEEEGASSKAGAEKKLEDIQIDLNSPEMMQKLMFTEMDYSQYLQAAHQFNLIPRYCKYMDNQYIEYVEKLHEYLQSFFERRNPLIMYKKVRSAFETEFERAWSEKRIDHWVTPTSSLTDCFALATNRLFPSKETCEGHKSGKQYKKALQRLSEDPTLADEIIQKSLAHDKSLARLEFLIVKYHSTLQYTVIERTLESLRKKQSRRLGELEDDWEEDDNPLAERESEPAVNLEVDSGSDDEDQAKIGNPLNVPLGFDGKPIPFWLYKLHGLGQEFKCEICGNYSYWGRKVFERHFQEWRHAFGMRCLKIPNTVHFKEITSIEEAIALFDKLKSETEAKSFLADKEIEIEDQDGNVMTMETFEDLRRQGVL